MRQNFEFGQPMQRLLARFAAHFRRRLQAGAACRAFRPTEDPAAEFGIEMQTRLAGWFVQRRDRRSDAAPGRHSIGGDTPQSFISDMRHCRRFRFWPFFAIDRSIPENGA